MRHLASVALAAAVVSAAACSDPNELPDASIRNVVDTVTIFAVSGTPIPTPSGYSIIDAAPVRIDSASTFVDFVYAIDTLPSGALRHVFLPRGALGLPSGGTASGLIRTDLAFDAIEVPRTNGYITEDTVVAETGVRYYLRSTGAGCSNFGGIPQYGKLEILDFAEDVRSVRFQVLTNNNCGYRSLEPGIPEE